MRAPKAALLGLPVLLWALAAPALAQQQCYRAQQQVNVSGRLAAAAAAVAALTGSGAAAAGGFCCRHQLACSCACPHLVQVRSQADICSGAKGSILPGDIVRH